MTCLSREDLEYFGPNQGLSACGLGHKLIADVALYVVACSLENELFVRALGALYPQEDTSRFRD